LAFSNRLPAPRMSIEADELHLWWFRVEPDSETAADVRSILSKYLGQSPDTIRIARSDRSRRPTLDGQSVDLSFNLSHSGTWGVLAIAWRTRVGIDIEQRREIKGVERLASRFLSSEEHAALSRVPKGEQSGSFLRLWVCKEAYLKALDAGVGVPAGLPRFSVSLSPDEPPAILETTLEVSGQSSLSLIDLVTPTGYVGAAAVEGGIKRIERFDI